jgi:tRNA(adenine34) deaminase
MVDEAFMRLALDEARRAMQKGEVPVGCVIVGEGGSVIARGHNMRESTQDPTAHAEVVAIREASAACGSWRLTGAALYVTLEPCAMCMGAIVLSRIRRVVFGCRDPKAGAVGSVYAIGVDGRLNHRVEVSGGVLEVECSRLLSEFFGGLRRARR